MRVNVQLIDAESGSHLWAERFEKPVTDLFDMQDEIVARLANSLNAQLVAVEARRADRAPTPDSMDLYFQGTAWVNRGVTPENMAKARGCFERALALDPINVDALVGLQPRRNIDAVAHEIAVAFLDDVAEVNPDPELDAALGREASVALDHVSIARPGTICLSEDAYRQVKGRLELAVTDLGPTQLKNIADPIRVYSLEVGQPAQPAAPTPEKSTPPRLSIVVLPFANIGGDPEQEYFVDGVTESLTTELSRISGSFVIARNTAFT